MHSKRIFTLVFTVLMIMNGCSDDVIEPKCPNPPPPPTISSNSPVNAADTLQLSADAFGRDIEFWWVGPAGYLSHEEDPIIPRVNPWYEGTYTCFVIVDACTSEVATMSVVVNLPPAPCSPADNTSEYPAGVLYANYNSVSEGVGGFDNAYKITASGDSSYLNIYFSTADAPENGVYRIIPFYYDLEPDYAGITIVDSSTYSDYYAFYGKLYVTRTNGKVTVTFCDIDFEGGDEDMDSVSAKVIVQ